jgi:catechol 2,3-dioxygenase-like lactoylglutathione lyase family enzyme
MTTIGAVVWGVRDIPRAVEFWTAALDYEPRAEPEPDWASLRPRAGEEGVQLSLKLISSATPRRHHLDLYSADQAADVERLLALGATPVDDWEYEEDADYVVLADPDGNAFCVVQK